MVTVPSKHRAASAEFYSVNVPYKCAFVSGQIMTTLITHTLDEFTFEDAEALYKHQGEEWSTEQLTALVDIIKTNDAHWTVSPMPTDQDDTFRQQIEINVALQFQQQSPSKSKQAILSMLHFIIENVPLYTRP